MLQTRIRNVITSSSNKVNVQLTKKRRRIKIIEFWSNVEGNLLSSSSSQGYKKMCLCDPQVVKEWILFRKSERKIRDVSVEGGGDGGLHDGSRISFFRFSPTSLALGSNGKETSVPPPLTRRISLIVSPSSSDSINAVAVVVVVLFFMANIID